VKKSSLVMFQITNQNVVSCQVLDHFPLDYNKWFHRNYKVYPTLARFLITEASMSHFFSKTMAISFFLTMATTLWRKNPGKL